MSFIKKWRKKAISMYGKARGLTKDQRAKVTSATHRGGSNPSNPSTSKTSRKVKKVARRRYLKRIKRRARKMTIPLAPIMGLAVGIATPRPGWSKSALTCFLDGEYENGFQSLSESYLGWNKYTGKFDMNLMGHGLLPLILGGLVHKYIGGSPINFNAMLARAKVPLIRI